MTYTSAPLRVAVKHSPNNSLKLGNFTPKKSFEKNNTNSDLFSEFVLFAYVHDEQKRASFYGESGASVHGAIQRSDKSEIISIWT